MGLVAEVVDASRSWLELSIFYISTTKKTAGVNRLSSIKKSPARNARLCIHAVVAFTGALDLRLDRVGLAIASRASEEVSEVAGSCLGSTDAVAIWAPMLDCARWKYEMTSSISVYPSLRPKSASLI